SSSMFGIGGGIHGGFRIKFFKRFALLLVAKATVIQSYGSSEFREDDMVVSTSKVGSLEVDVRPMNAYMLFTF
ncbi:MAG: hypothetical protein IH946_10300, partial [Bacteroidetes bacterium]|nr:hypothetical protein [Bacteroidota bacterium]